MALTGNKGEWSEIYTLFKLLADGKVNSADGQLNKIENLYYIIKEILRIENNSEEFCYKINNNKIKIIGANNEISISREYFSQIAQTLYNYIITANPPKGKTLSFPDIEQFMNSINCFSIKAKSQDKADLRMVIHDIRSGMEHKLGFSIKSKLGGKSTLFNSNKDSTNFLYKIKGLNKKQIEDFNKESLFSKKFEILYRNNGEITYVDVVNKVFKNNLHYIDCSLDTILGYCLIEYYSHSGRSMSDIIEKVTLINPCGFPNTMDFYAHKMKQMLLTSALGMTSSNVWSGRYDANGGYLVVKENGDIVCYHFYDRNDLEDYLFYNTGFETPSTSRHNFGEIYEKDGEFWLKLNLQIRFIH
ncbi:MAG: HpaII family restriction endonuclease [Bacteroidales bacterium]|nr:HpaII family restriction endonuclease [Bacteroidales bacterium]